MVQNPPAGSQRIVPHLVYEDAPAAIAFLCWAFGFGERFRIEHDGKIVHAELEYGGDLVMLASVLRGVGHASPRDLRANHGSTLVYVDDVDAHCARARAAGAKILTEPEDKLCGDRMYGARDPEGHDWVFATHFLDVAPEDLRP